MRILVWLLVLLVCTATAVSRLLPRLWWVFDVLASFHPQYFIALTLALLLFIYWKSRWGMGITAVFALINLFPLLPYYLPAAQPAAPEPTIRLMLSNVYSFRPNLDSVLALTHESDADIIVLLEMVPFHYNEVQTLRQTHPYFFHNPRITGKAVFSRLPLDSIKLQPFAGGRIDVVVEVAGKRPFTIIATHLKPTVSPAKAAQRNAHFVDMAQHVHQHEQPLVIIGDFNSSPWSAYFREFVRETGLRNGRLGNGLTPTWPAPRFALNQFPHLAPALTPLDHVLYSNAILLHTFRRGPYVGSDHYPLIVDLSVK